MQYPDSHIKTIWIFIFFVNSPYTSYSSNAYLVGPSGVIIDYGNYGVYYSYGGNSPDTIGPSYSKNVHRTGIVLGNTNGSVIDSYGI